MLLHCSPLRNFVIYCFEFSFRSIISISPLFVKTIPLVDQLMVIKVKIKLIFKLLMREIKFTTTFITF